MIKHAKTGWGTFLLALSLLPATQIAQGAELNAIATPCQPVIVPKELAGIDSAAGSGLLYFPIRLQEVYGAGQFPTNVMVIQELRLRPSAAFGSVFTATVSSLQIRLSTTQKQPGALSATFASNVGADEVVVFNGAIELSSAFTGPAGGPKDFDIVIRLSTPFSYDPARGNLLVDWRNANGSTATYLDAGLAPGTASRAFAVGAGSTVATTRDGGAEVIKFCFTTPQPPCEPLVLPGVFAGLEAGGGSSVLRDAIRLQEVYGAGQFPTNPVVIRELRWRPSALYGSAFTGSVANLQLNLSTTLRAPDGLSATFAQNVGVDDTVVFSGAAQMSSAFTGPVGGPKDFDMVVTLSTPFVYDPARGNLLVDVRNHSGGPVAFVDGGHHANDQASRAFALGTGSTVATTVDTGADAIQICFTPTNRPPVIQPPLVCDPLVVPKVLAGIDSAAGSGLLRYPIRLQEVYGAGQLSTNPVVIHELRLRPSAAFGSAFTATVSNLQIRLSTTHKQPEGLSATFANNVGSDEVVVFNGEIELTSAFTGPVSGPKDFDIVIPLSTPFVYDPARGNLLVDWRNVTGSAATFLDAGLAPGDEASRAFALGAGSTVATTMDGGAEVIRFCVTPTNLPPVIPPPSSCDPLVLPEVFADMEAGGGSSVLRDAIRLQEVYGAGQFPTNPVVIRELRWRPSAIYSGAFTGSIANLQLNLSTTRRSPDGLRATFAQNVGADDTVVFSGTIQLSSGFTGPAGGPKDFDIVVPLTTPFFYDPARGNLLVDVRNHSGGPVAFVDGGHHVTDQASRVFALGAGSTVATTVDTGSDVIEFCFTPTNRLPSCEPLASIKVSPLYAHPSLEGWTVMALCNTNGYAVLSASALTEGESNTLDYFWFLDGSPVASARGALVTNCFSLGLHEIVLAADNGTCVGTDTVTIEVVSGSEFVELIIAEVDATALNSRVKRSLNSHLKMTQMALDRCEVPLALASLEAFQNKLQVLIRTSQPGLREQLTRSTQGLVNAITAAQSLQDAVECDDTDE